ncbi:hypothetical protein DFS34DRAFT_645544 [Phlyctochytrium arcticum]|nr:hypothetical protein DFS34DRAFT_645544 [Phlyctochytrium arcticum]
MPLVWSNITSNYKYLGTVGFAALGWFLAFIGLCVLQAEYDSLKPAGKNAFSAAWFHLFFWLAILLCVVFLLLTASIDHYRIAVVALLGVGFVFIVEDLDASLDALSRRPSDRFKGGYGVFASGLFFMSFCYIPWIFFFGSSEGALANNGNDSFAFSIPRLNTRFGGARNGAPNGSGIAPALPPQEASMYASSEPSRTLGNDPEMAKQPPVAAPVLKATALFPYDANQEDPTEVSFAKGDVLEVLSNQGKWWQVRTPSGAVGIAPSNYLQVV